MQNPGSYLGVGGLFRPLKVRPSAGKHVLELRLKLRRRLGTDLPIKE